MRIIKGDVINGLQGHQGTPKEKFTIWVIVNVSELGIPSKDTMEYRCRFVRIGF